MRALLLVGVVLVAGCATTKDLEREHILCVMGQTEAKAAAGMLDDQVNNRIDNLAKRVESLEHPSSPPSGDEVTDFLCNVAVRCHADGQTDVACRGLWDECLKRETKEVP